MKRYLNTQTLKQTTEYLDSKTVIDTDPRVSNWFKPCPEGYKGEWVGDTYTFTLIPLPTQAELDVAEALRLQSEVNQEALAYLGSTDWMLLRELDGGTVMDAEVKQLRADARLRIV